MRDRSDGFLQKEVEDPLSMEILKGAFSPGDAIDVDIKADKITFRKQALKKELQGPGQPAGLLTGEKEAEKVIT